MDVRAGRLMGDGSAEREERDSVVGEVAAEPDAFGLIGIHRDIDPSAVIETESAMDGCLAVGADRKHDAKASFKRGLDLGEDHGAELSVAVEAFGDRMLAGLA